MNFTYTLTSKYRNEILKAYKLNGNDVKDDMLLSAVLTIISTKDSV